MTAEQKWYDSCQPDSFNSQKIDSEIQEQLDKFNQFINELIKEKSDTCYNLIAFTNSKLRQFKLLGVYEDLDIIHLAVIRAKNKISKKEKVTNFNPWLKQIILYIIREVYRKEKSHKDRSKKLMNKNLLISENIEIPERSIKKNINALYEAFYELSESDRCILLLRQGHDFSWKKISSILIEKGLEEDDDKTVNRIRKKGSRAFKKLRDSFNNKLF